MVSEHKNQLLQQIKEGMPVKDIRGKHIGDVEWVRFAEDRAATPSGGEDALENTLVAEVAEALTEDDRFPEELRSRMLRHGYLRIDRSVIQRDAYALADHIENVADGTVYLNVPSDELITK